MPATAKSGLRIWIGLAAGIVIVAGFKAAATLIVPILISLFLTLLFLPGLHQLQRAGVGDTLSIVVIIGLVTAAILGVVSVLGSSVAEFQTSLPFYETRINEIVTNITQWVNERGIKLNAQSIASQIDGSSVLSLVGNTAQAMLDAMSNGLLVLLTVIFMLFEATDFPAKLSIALGNPDQMKNIEIAGHRVRQYLAMKAVVSVATGALVGIACASVGLQFPLLWALIAFLFNFVPNIGSMIAAIPAVVLAILQLGFPSAVVLSIAYIVINLVIGNVIEPRLLGQKLGLSTLVVFLSMLFWGWIWGPVGMLLSVPLTVIVKIIFEQFEETKAIAILLGSTPQQ